MRPTALLAFSFSLPLVLACGSHGTGGGAASWSHGDGSQVGWIQVRDDYVSASFFHYTTTPYDNLLAYGCEVTTGGDYRAYVGAGDLTISVAGADPYVIPAPATPFDYSGSHDFALNELTVRASGGDVPAFEVKLTPSSATSVQVTTPPIGKGSMPAIKRTADLELTWKGGTSGDFVFSMGPMSVGLQSVICVAPAADGHITIPSTTLAVLKEGPQSIFGSIADIVRFNAGNYQISLARALPAGILGCDIGDCKVEIQP
jgi:hypothetical protein